MNIEGTYTFQTTLAEVDQNLKKSAVLKLAIPGLEQLEPLEQNRYDVAIHIKYSPLIGTYHGLVAVAEDPQTATYRLSIEGNGAANTFSGTGSIQLRALGDNTSVLYKATLTLNKRGARLSPAVSRGAAKLLIQQFFTSLSNQLRRDHAISANEDIDETSSSLIPYSPSNDQIASPSLASSVVRFLHLGRKNALEEAVWTERLRQVGFVSGFLVLVWIGTRLPRRR